MQMQSLIPYALPAVVLVTALGALVTAFVMVRWGSSRADEALDEDLEGESDEASRRLVWMVRRERAARRERAFRAGHTVAVVCFATATVLVVTALASGIIRRPATLIQGPDVEARNAPVKEAQARLEERVRALEERLTVAEARVMVPPAASAGPETAPSSPAEERTTPPAPAETTAPPASPAAKPEPATSPPASLPSRAPTSPRTRPSQRDAAPSVTVAPRSRPGSPPATTGERAETRRPANATSALPRGVTATSRTTVGSVRLEILRDPERPAPGTPTRFTVRLSDAGGAPLVGADVLVHGRMADGSTVQTSLDPADSAGTYAGAIVITSSGPWDLRLRVARGQTAFELPLANPTAW